MSIKVEGLKELEEKLKQLPQKLAKKYLASALKKGLEITQMREKALAHHGPPSEKQAKYGRLVDSIKIYQRTKNLCNTGASIEFGLKPIKGKKPNYLGGWKAHFLEFGTRPHRIPKKGESVLRLPTGELYSHVKHPGAKAYPFINPAIDATWQRAVQKAQEVLEDKLEEEMR
jgi:HK97 gp10 family phage protein